jgi:hypothetical protein
MYCMITLDTMRIVTSYDWDNVKPQLCFGKPHAHGKRHVVCVYNKAATMQDMFLVQTPLMYMPYSGLYDDYGNVSIELCGNNTDMFFSFINTLQEHVCKHVQKRFDTSNKQFISLIKPPDLFYGQRLKLRGVAYKDLHVFNARKEKQVWSDIHKEEKLVCLIAIRHVWISEQTYGIRAQLLQVLKTEPSFATCVIETSDPLDTYHRMKRAGVHSEAIAHKMRLDGVPESTIVSFTSHQPQKPLIPLAMPQNPLRSALLGAVQAGVTLKKVSDADKKTKVLANVDTTNGFKPPSLDALLNMKAKLRSIKNI